VRSSLRDAWRSSNLEKREPYTLSQHQPGETTSYGTVPRMSNFGAHERAFSPQLFGLRGEAPRGCWRSELRSRWRLAKNDNGRVQATRNSHSAGRELHARLGDPLLVIFTRKRLVITISWAGCMAKKKRNSARGSLQVGIGGTVPVPSLAALHTHTTTKIATNAIREQVVCRGVERWLLSAVRLLRLPSPRILFWR
jgi:hypothetical protein